MLIFNAGGGNITSISTNIEAGKDINLLANNINLLTAQNTSNSAELYTHKEIKATASIGNSYLDAINAASNLGASLKQNKDSLIDYLDTKEGYNKGLNFSAAVTDSTLNMLFSVANTANSAIAASGAFNAAANCATSFCTGFYASVGLQYETSKNYSAANGSSEVGNTVKGVNINFKSDNNIEIEGGNIESTGKVQLDAVNNINIRAAETVDNNINLSTNSSVSSSVNTNLNISANYNAGNQSGQSYSKHYENAKVTANDIEIKANNLTGKGTNIEATNNIGINIANNLNLETVQDESSSDANSKGYGFGTTTKAQKPRNYRQRRNYS